jgi:secondary thiamine-phosphate synthase enzyme
MSIITGNIRIKTKADVSMTNITEQVQKCVSESGLKEGIAVVFCPGSTGALSTVEYEPGLIKDVPEALERLAPRNGRYAHHDTWHDDNGSGHVKATILGPSLTVPITEARLTLGKWQQIVFLECDSKDRERALIVKLIGE